MAVAAPNHRACRAAALSLLAMGVLSLLIASGARADFGFSSFSAKFEDSSGQPQNVAGAYANLTTILRMNKSGDVPEGTLKSIEMNFPAGFYGDTDRGSDLFDGRTR